MRRFGRASSSFLYTVQVYFFQVYTVSLTVKNIHHLPELGAEFAKAFFVRRRDGLCNKSQEVSAFQVSTTCRFYYCEKFSSRIRIRIADPPRSFKQIHFQISDLLNPLWTRIHRITDPSEQCPHCFCPYRLKIDRKLTKFQRKTNS